MNKKKKPSGAFKHKQRQEREDSKQKLPKIDKFLVSLLQVLLAKILLLIVTQIMWRRPTEEASKIQFSKFMMEPV
ncbi:unnamed protein product [Parnassius apollo]|uniref:(apollo) hypothetical protein n=1 Tax=Parnassius apollo TaxID=110799 RepID=A0A8S3Y3M5_PARAO|nr:unnamed protein product [Parnassius apollo]